MAARATVAKASLKTMAKDVWMNWRISELSTRRVKNPVIFHQLLYAQGLKALSAAGH